jgi:hypothetical protein
MVIAKEKGHWSMSFLFASATVVRKERKRKDRKGKGRSVSPAVDTIRSSLCTNQKFEFQEP